MPHAIIEHSSNLDHAFETQHILHVIHAVMETSGLFNPSSVKTRRSIAKEYIVGQIHEHASFVHITVVMMEGRSDEQKKTLSEKLFQAVHERLPQLSSLTVDVRDANPNCYRKK